MLHGKMERCVLALLVMKWCAVSTMRFMKKRWKKPVVREMDFTGKPMKGYVFVSTEGLKNLKNKWNTGLTCVLNSIKKQSHQKKRKRNNLIQCLNSNFNTGSWLFPGNIPALPVGILFLSQKNIQEIRTHFKKCWARLGRLPAKIKIGNTEWQSAIWFDTKQDTYLLPLKAAVRKKEDLTEGKKLPWLFSLNAWD